MKAILTVFSAVTLMLGAGAASAAVDNEALKEGVQDICSDYGGEYWENSDGLFGCEIDDLDADIWCVEDAGCTVFDAAVARGGRSRVSASTSVKIQNTGGKLLATKANVRDYCARAVRDHRFGAPAARAQQIICRKNGLVVGR